MRELFPEVRDLTPDDLAELYGRAAGVRLNMIGSADGAATSGGQSGPLGGAADKQLFAFLRSFADVIVIGAGTWRAERYGPVRLPAAVRARRREAGMAEVPPIAVITASAQLDWSRPFFTEAEARPLLLTASAAPEAQLAEARQVADVIVAGDDRVDLADAFQQLQARGFSSVLAEGGPTVGAQLAVAGLLDELCLTISPKIVAGNAPRILDGPALPDPLDLTLVHLLEEDGFLFLLYRKA